MTAVSTSSRLGLLAALVLALGACDSEDGDDAGDSAATDGDVDDASMGQVEFRFTVSSTVRDSSSLQDELKGKVYGGLFRSADVAATGPRDGAEQLAFIETEELDLSAGPTDLVWMSEGLPPDTYTFLGFFDVDGSSLGTEEKDPESGDPVTLPAVNQLMVAEGQVTEFEVRFDLVLN